MKYFTKKRIFAAVFLLGVFSFSAVNIYNNRFDLLNKAEKYESEPQKIPAKLEEVMEDGVYGKLQFVEAYGLTQKVLGKEEFNSFSYVKDNTGFLHYAAFYRDEQKEIFQYALRVKKLQNYAEKYGTKVLFVMAPAKYNREYTEFKTGMPVNDPSEDTYEMMVYLNRLGVPCINLAEDIPSADIPYEKAFFKTDHHWTVPAAFKATKIIVDDLNERYGANLDPTGYYMSDDAYTKKEYKNQMLGSMGRDTGIVYSGLEDFEAYLPNFSGHYKRTYTMKGEETLEGTYSDALLDLSVLEPTLNKYEDSPYSLYIKQVTNLEHIENLENTDGPSVLMIRDSFFGPVISFMAPMCSKIDAIWSKEDMDDINVGEYIKGQYEKGEKYDYLIVQYYPHNLEDDAFKFFRGDHDNEN